ncbi:hypothetical protein O7634_14535 [Micromonospora sp. WMMD1120]|uniref:hypothetical protein n=1 Tax=Micromonospora sp. WMMD1120 TaxID=3016106 RepID=UPI002415C08D|nr:hypothetical protein [Micromonospora sp. WMMD1120]MDG4807970.1 hypothetical protein [Micromonospora sp. WMMD1120]
MDQPQLSTHTLIMHTDLTTVATYIRAFHRELYAERQLRMREARMNDHLRGLLPDGSIVMLVGMVAGVVIGLVRAYLRHRTRIHAERELSARTAARAAGLITLVSGRHENIKIDERDRDGHRVVELRGPQRTSDKEAA